MMWKANKFDAWKEKCVCCLAAIVFMKMFLLNREALGLAKLVKIE